MGVREGGTSWVGGMGVHDGGVYVGGVRYVGRWGGTLVGGGVRKELVKNAVFGHFLEIYYILAAPG